jgi:hypothetical protein
MLDQLTGLTHILQHAPLVIPRASAHAQELTGRDTRLFASARLARHGAERIAEFA